MWNCIYRSSQLFFTSLSNIKTFLMFKLINLCLFFPLASGAGHVQPLLAQLLVSVSFPSDASLVRDPGICLWLRLGAVPWRHRGHFHQHFEVFSLSHRNTSIACSFSGWCKWIWKGGGGRSRSLLLADQHLKLSKDLISSILFRILALEKLGAVFNQVAFPLQYTPRKFVIHPETNNLVLIETDHNAYTEATKAQRKQQMAEVWNSFQWVCSLC